MRPEVALLGLLLLFTGLAHACISIPYVEIGDFNFSVATWDVRAYANISDSCVLPNATVAHFDAYMSHKHGSRWTGPNFSSEEKELLSEFSESGYSPEWAAQSGRADALNSIYERLRGAGIIATPTPCNAGSTACEEVYSLGGLDVTLREVKEFAGLPTECPQPPEPTVEQFDAYMGYRYNDSINGRNYWAELNLTPAEKAAVWEFVKHGYSVKKMAPGQYSEFRMNAILTNVNPFTCEYYSAVAYREGFAGYVFSQYSDKTPLCTTAPRMQCGGGFFLPFINDLPASAPQKPEATPTRTPSSEPGLPFVGSGAGEAPTQPQGAEKQGEGESAWLAVMAAVVPVGAVLLLFAAFVLFSIMNRRAPEEGYGEVETHRALSSETRLALMRELQLRDLTPTDLSTKVGRSKATVVEHLERLVDAGFVEKKEEEGKKFVFYGLTGKGKAILRQAG